MSLRAVCSIDEMFPLERSSMSKYAMISNEIGPRPNTDHPFPVGVAANPVTMSSVTQHNLRHAHTNGEHM